MAMTTQSFRPKAAMGTGSTSAPIETTLASRVEQRLRAASVARTYSRVEPMPSTNHGVPILVAGTPTVAVVAEAATINLTDGTLDRADLVAAKVAARVIMSNELYEDAGDNTDFLNALADQTANNIAYEIDSHCFVNGQGVVTSVNEALAAGSKVSVASLAAATIDDFAAAISLIRESGSASPPRWYMSRESFGAAAVRLQGAVGYVGTDAIFLGAPVVFCEALKAAGSGDVVAIYGRLEEACVYGVARETRVQWLTELSAATDSTQLCVTHRFGFDCHDNDGGAISAVVIT